MLAASGGHPELLDAFLSPLLQGHLHLRTSSTANPLQALDLSEVSQPTNCEARIQIPLHLRASISMSNHPMPGIADSFLFLPQLSESSPKHSLLLRAAIEPTWMIQVNLLVLRPFKLHWQNPFYHVIYLSLQNKLPN